MPLYEFEGIRPEVPAADQFWVAPDATVVGKVRCAEASGGAEVSTVDDGAAAGSVDRAAEPAVALSSARRKSSRHQSTSVRSKGIKS